MNREGLFGWVAVLAAAFIPLLAGDYWLYLLTLTGAYGDTHKVQPAAATVAQNVPSIYALPAKLIKTKVQYLTLQYNDPDSKVSGTASFKLDNKDILDSVLVTLANKSGLTRRGEVFVRKKDQNNP